MLVHLDYYWPWRARLCLPAWLRRMCVSMRFVWLCVCLLVYVHASLSLPSFFSRSLTVNFPQDALTRCGIDWGSPRGTPFLKMHHRDSLRFTSVETPLSLAKHHSSSRWESFVDTKVVSPNRSCMLISYFISIWWYCVIYEDEGNSDYEDDGTIDNKRKWRW